MLLRPGVASPSPANFTPLHHAASCAQTSGLGRLAPAIIDIVGAADDGRSMKRLRDNPVRAIGHVCAALFPLPAMRPDLQHRVLHHILGIGATAQKPKRNAKRTIDMTLDKISRMPSRICG